jgi:steroid 5-alpha reductase family enzyme
MGMATNDYSWVDRFWSITPIIYVWILLCSGKPGLRLIVASVLVTLWGLRLTYNFARKGGYSGKEDYRWGELRKIIKSKTLWALFNFFFISLYQHLLIVLFTLPVYIIYLGRSRSFGLADVFLSLLFLAFLALETIADQQQWDFQQKKSVSMAGGVITVDAGGDISRGFITHGLFRFSRHPNYFAEICIWWVVYLFGCCAEGGLFNWTCAGAILLTMLFQGSAVWTENISGRKYPEYALYQKETSKIFPWFSKDGHNKLETVKIPEE